MLVFAGIALAIAVVVAAGAWFARERPLPIRPPAVASVEKDVTNTVPKQASPLTTAPALPARVEPEAEGSIIVDAGIASADVSLDGRTAAHTDQHGIALLREAPGRHTLSIVKPGFTEHRQAIEIQSGATTILKLALKPVETASKFTPPPSQQPAASTPAQVTIDTANAAPR